MCISKDIRQFFLAHSSLHLPLHLHSVLCFFPVLFHFHSVCALFVVEVGYNSYPNNVMLPNLLDSGVHVL